MSEHTTEIRILGGNAREVLRALLENGKEVSLEGGYFRLDKAIIDGLGTRADGVVWLSIHEAGDLPPWPPSWVVYRHTSVSRGIDWRSIQVTRGDENLADLSESPDGCLTASFGGVEVEVIERVDADGNVIEDASDWQEFAARHLEALAVQLGAGKVVLDDNDVVAPQGAAAADDDDVAF